MATLESIVAKTNGTPITWSTAMDNREHTRNFATGDAVRYVAGDGHTRAIWLRHSGQLKDAYRAVYVVDDGKSAVPYYTAGWNDKTAGEEWVSIHEFPVNPDGRCRPDNGLPIDFAGWMLGPRRCYHLKITEGE